MAEQGCCDLSCWERRTKADKLCAVGMTVALSLAVIGLIVTITVYELGITGTCRKTECVKQASRTLKMMDRSMNPCEDFYQYACGGYLSDASTRDKSVLIEQINQLNDLVKVILTDNVKYGEPRFLSFPKMLYKACMDQDKIIQDGLKPITEIMKQFGEWPVTTREWDKDTFNWIVLVKRFRESGLPFGYLIQVNHIEEEGAKLLFRGGTTYPKLISGQKRNEDIISHYQKTLIDIARKFGADRNQSEKDMKAVVEFEISLAKISENNRLVERITIENLEKNYPFINWLTFVRSSLGLNVHTSEVVLIVPAYIEALEGLLQNTPQRVVANYMMTKLHLFIIDLLPKDAVIYEGERQSHEERQKLCIDFIRSNLWVAVAALYQQRYFNQHVSDGVKEIVKLLEREFERAIKKANWMNDVSKKIALRKLRAMEVHIAFPSEMMDTRKLDNFHGDLGGQSAMGTWKWIKNFVTGAILSFKRTNHIVSDMSDSQQSIVSDRTIQDPKDPIDMSVNVMNEIAEKVEHRNTISKYNWWNMGVEAKWLRVSDQIQVRAKFEPQYNMLDVRAGILRGGFYHNELPDYVNFGAIGAILAHELVHSIDNKGRSFDEFGKLRHPWRESSKKIVEHKFKCMIDQYDNFVEPLTGRKLNGTATLDENIADNIGLLIAYKAYLSWVNIKGHDPFLPGLNLTGSQLFWVANAQTQCANPSVKKISKQMDQNDAAPERFRIIGSISNNKDFARDFQCPLGSPMNPKHKCKFW